MRRLMARLARALGRSAYDAGYQAGYRAARRDGIRGLFPRASDAQLDRVLALRGEHS